MGILDTIVEAAIAASEVINSVSSRPILSAVKRDGTPVTDADTAAEGEIAKRLSPIGLPVLGEESAAAGRIPDLGPRFFVVDPLDGTKEFLEGSGEFTVNIGLIEDGFPVMGIVMAPATGIAWIGSPGGAFAFDAKASIRWSLRSNAKSPLRVVGSRSHGQDRLMAFGKHLDIASHVSMGSSLKFCILAEGEAQVYPRFTPTCEWDTAAGQAVLEAAGGVVLDLDGNRLSYGHATRKFLNPFFVAAASEAIGLQAAVAMREVCRHDTSTV